MWKTLRFAKNTWISCPGGSKEALAVPCDDVKILFYKSVNFNTQEASIMPPR